MKKLLTVLAAGGPPTAVNAVYYARIVERKAVLRNLIGAAGQIAGIGILNGETRVGCQLQQGISRDAGQQ